MKKPELKDLTLREKVAQLMIVLFSDILMEPETNYTSIRSEEDAKRLMEEGQFGGIWLNGNIDINGVNDFYNKNFHYTSQTSRELSISMTTMISAPPPTATSTYCHNWLCRYLAIWLALAPGRFRAGLPKSRVVA